MWPVVIQAAHALGAITVELTPKLPAGSLQLSGPPIEATYAHPAEPFPPAADLFRYPFTIPCTRAGDPSLILGWDDGRTSIDRDTEIAAEIFCEHLGEALDALRVTTLSTSPRQIAPPV